MHVDLNRNEYVCRIVYFGPGLSGKTSNLEYLSQQAPAAWQCHLRHHDRDGERLLHLSYRPVEAPDFDGLRGRFDVLTIPGRSYYVTNRRDILNDADGIVFVADSRREAIDENIDAMNEMWSFINHNKLSDQIPIVIQFNKQDLDTALPKEQLDPLLNSQMHPAFAATATSGSGVFETLAAIQDRVLARCAMPDRITAATKPPSQDQPAPRSNVPPPTETADSGWLLTCFHCDSVLEVDEANPGDLYSCGSCGTVLEVLDPNTGTTRPGKPRPPAPAVQEPVTPPPGSGRQAQAAAAPQTGTSDFTIQGPDSQNLSFETGADLTPTGQQAISVPTLPGFDFLEQLDVSLLGCRYRTLELERNRHLRALALNPMLLRQPGYADRLEPHMRLAGQIRHPNIVPLVALRWAGQTPIIFGHDTPEYESLNLILARRRTLAPPQAMGIIRQLALALEEAARQGITHGWIRPEVVLLNPSGNVLLDDLSIPKNPDFLVRESMGGSASTEYYLAPEHLHGEINTDIRTDIFLLGALFFRMVTGEGLVTGYSAHEALHKLTTNGPRSLRDAKSDLSRELDAFFMNLVAVDRKDRLQRHQDLLSILEKFGGGARRQTMRAVRGPHTARVSKRRTGQSSGANPQLVSKERITTRGDTVRKGRSFSTQHLPDEEDRRRRRSNGLLPLIIILGLLSLGAAILAFNPDFYQTAPLPSDQPERPTPSPQAHSPAPVVATPSHSTDTPPSASPTDSPALPNDPIARASQRLSLFRANPSDTNLFESIRVDLLQLKINGDDSQRRAASELLIELLRLHSDYQVAQEVPTPSTNPTTSPPVEPTPDNAPAVENQSTLASLKLALQNLLRDERYAAALTLVDQGIADPELRAFYHEDITTRHNNSRNSVARLSRSAPDMSEVQRLLSGPRERWGLAGDDAFADELELEARARLDGEPAPTDTTDTVADKPESAPDAITSIAGIPLPILLADARSSSALANHNPALAAQQLVPHDNSDPRIQAMQLKIDLLAKGPAVIGPAFAEHQPKVRIQTPFGEQRWDVVGVSPGGIEVRSPKDEKTHLAWKQVSASDRAQVYEKVADASNLPEQHAIASAALIVAGQLGPARIAASKARKAAYAQASLLDNLIDMALHHRSASLIEQAEHALSADDGMALAQALRTLREDDKLRFPERDTALARYQAAADPRLSELPRDPNRSPDQPVTQRSERDNLRFNEEADLLAFPIRDGRWRIENEHLVVDGTRATLLRSDLNDAIACEISLSTSRQAGLLHIDFRGTEFLLDFQRQGFSAANSSGSSAFSPFPILVDLPYSIAFTVEGDAMQMSLNQTKSVRMGSAGHSDQLRITAENCNILSLHKIQIRRDQAQAPAGTNTNEGAVLLKKVLGWDAIGGAELRAPEIVLPIVRVGRSAIARPIAAQGRIRFRARGNGKLLILIGNRSEADFQQIDLLLPADQEVLQIDIAWQAGSATITSQSPNDTEATTESFPLPNTLTMSDIMLQAERSLTILSPPEILSE